ncbi:MAG: 3-hydroxyacyl-CoA dehydrogenase NAD-binding domain-containing protein [Paracoccaceae bacterium]|nr:3-hydroxyacyl-CoA dehydrogenase NAD-binding domain-containing protein [Paracoccaceae bacterium]
MTIGIVGLGAMGLGIAQVFAQAGHDVRATDAVEAARHSARDRLAASLAPRVAKGAMTEVEGDAALARLTIVDRVEEVAPADLVIEAVAEWLEVKRAVFRALEPLLPADAVLATNTSSLSVTAIADGLARPGQVLGLHFFNPAPVMKLVELVAHAGTTPQALDRARSLAEGAGKVVIACADRPGFIVNRCARPYYGEAVAMLEVGRPAAEIDAAMVASGYRLGPFALIDLVGADINLAATESLSAAMGGHPRYHVFDALRDRVARGDLGRKTGRGFVHPQDPVPPPPDSAEIALRIESALANEAGWLLSEGGVTAEGIDLAMRLGLNFPRGPFEALARHGKDRVLAVLSSLEAAAPPHLKTRYLPAPTL